MIFNAYTGYPAIYALSATPAGLHTLRRELVFRCIMTVAQAVAATREHAALALWRHLAPASKGGLRNGVQAYTLALAAPVAA